jgi:hypothetical protein
MKAYWVRFRCIPPACVEAKTQGEALTIAGKAGIVVAIDLLPYPANPRMEPKTDTPSFCYSPRSCKGSTSCPKRKACDD